MTDSVVDPLQSIEQTEPNTASTSPQPLFSKLLQSQTAKLLNVLENREAGMTYKNAAITTLNLLLTLIVFLSYVFVAVFALLVWIWGNGFHQGREFRKWVEDEKPSPNEVVCAALNAIATPFRRLYVWAEAYSRKLLS